MTGLGCCTHSMSVESAGFPGIQKEESAACWRPEQADALAVHDCQWVTRLLKGLTSVVKA